MTTGDEFALAAFRVLMEKAEPKLAAALAQYGVQSPDQLPSGLAFRIFQEVLIQTAGENFPRAQLDALKHGLTAFQHPRFGPALTRLKAQLASTNDAFAFASGTDAAIVLSAFGLPVAPFDRKAPRILANPTNNIDEVAEAFSKSKTAYVGYSPCDTPFYMLFTDCMRTMRSQISNRPQLQQVKEVLKRTGMDWPNDPLPAFKHGIILIPREPGDTVSTVALENQNPDQGSVIFYAGWSSNGVRGGAPNGGFLPVPLQFVQGALQDPQIALWIWRPVGVRVKLN